MPDSFQPWVYVPPTLQWQRAGEINQLLAQIPADASVTATTYLVPHVSGRRAVLRMPMTQYLNDQGETQDVDYVVADLWRLRRYQVAFSADGDRLAYYTEQIQTWLDSGHLWSGVIP